MTLAYLQIGPNFAGLLATESTPLAISATNWAIDASNAGRVSIDFGTNAFTGTLLNGPTSGADSSFGLDPVRIKGAHASNILQVLAGTIGIATNLIGDTASIPLIDVLGGTVNCSVGVTLSVINQQAASNINVNSSLPTLAQVAGTLTTNGSGTLGGTALEIGGTVVSNATGNVSNIVIVNGGTLDFSQTAVARATAGVATLYSGASLIAQRSISPWAAVSSPRDAQSPTCN